MGVNLPSFFNRQRSNETLHLRTVFEAQHLVRRSVGTSKIQCNDDRVSESFCDVVFGRRVTKESSECIHERISLDAHLVELLVLWEQKLEEDGFIS